MTILAIETSTQVCSAAWCRDGVCLAERIQEAGSNHAAVLPVFIDELLAEARQQGWQADAVAVSEGPGSYTGLRIGLSTAKGLCYGWNVPLIPISTMDVLCAAAREQLGEKTGILVPMLDARRMEVYTRVNGEVKAQIVTDADWLPQGDKVYYFGDGAAKCKELLESPRCTLLEHVLPVARVMGALAEKAEKRIGEKELAYFTPYYLKEFVAAPSHVKGLA